MFGFGKKKSTTYAACFDVASGSVGVAIVASEAGVPAPVFVYAERIQMQIPKGQDASARLNALKEAFLAAAMDLSHKGLPALAQKDASAHIDIMQVTCSAPWAHTVSRTVRLIEDTPFKITEELIEELGAKADNDSKETVGESALAASFGLTPVHHQTIHTKINGYPVSDPVGNTGLSFELVHLIELIATPVTELIAAIQEKVLPHTELHMHTYMSSLYQTTRMLWNDVSEATFIDISQDATEIGLMEDHILSRVTHITEGTGTVFSDTTGNRMPRGHIEGLVAAYMEKTLPEADRARIKKHIDAYKDRIVAVFNSLYETDYVPETIIVTSPYGVSKLLEDAVLTAFSAAIPKQGAVRDIRIALQGGGKIPDTTDTFLAIAAFFFHKIKRG